jgi:hypothetical protein
MDPLSTAATGYTIFDVVKRAGLSLKKLWTLAAWEAHLNSRAAEIQAREDTIQRLLVLDQHFRTSPEQRLSVSVIPLPSFHWTDGAYLGTFNILVANQWLGEGSLLSLMGWVSDGSGLPMEFNTYVGPKRLPDYPEGGQTIPRQYSWKPSPDWLTSRGVPGAGTSLVQFSLRLAATGAIDGQPFSVEKTCNVTALVSPR